LRHYPVKVTGILSVPILKPQNKRSGFNDTNLIVIRVVILRLVIDIVVAKFVRVFGRRHNPHPIPQTMLLQVLFGQVLEVAFGKWARGDDGNLALHPGHSHRIAELPSLAVDLNPLVQKLLLLMKTTPQTRDATSALCG
jgi:hypothetical protein